MNKIAQEYRKARLFTEAAWTEFALEMVPPDATKQQYDETRIAFFCGGMFVYDTLIQLAKNELPSEELQPLQDELDNFAGLMLMGAAEGSA
jgi:hypothetical protein